MAIDFKKILTISAKEWSEISGKNLRDYDIEGVHCEGIMMSIGEKFSKRVPNEAEIVVGYQYAAATEGASGGFSASVYATGTALIPRKDRG